MKRIIIEKLLIYSIAFVVLYLASASAGTKITKMENEYKKNIYEVMEEYNYTERTPFLYDLEFLQGNNTVEISYYVNDKELLLDSLHVKNELNYTDNLSDIYVFLNKLYDEDVAKYNDYINQMVTKYFETNEEQRFEDQGESRQLILRIEKPKSDEKDFQLYYGINYYSPNLK